MRPFRADLFTGWYGYREFSDGPVPGFGSHFIDLMNAIVGSKLPTSAVCLGGTLVWNDEHRFTCPDHVQALWMYPEGFMVSYSDELRQRRRQLPADLRRPRDDRPDELARADGLRRRGRQAREARKGNPGQADRGSGPLPRLAPMRAQPQGVPRRNRRRLPTCGCRDPGHAGLRHGTAAGLRRGKTRNPSGVTRTIATGSQRICRGLAQRDHGPIAPRRSPRHTATSSRSWRKPASFLSSSFALFEDIFWTIRGDVRRGLATCFR